MAQRAKFTACEMSDWASICRTRNFHESFPDPTSTELSAQLFNLPEWTNVSPFEWPTQVARPPDQPSCASERLRMGIEVGLIALPSAANVRRRRAILVLWVH